MTYNTILIPVDGSAMSNAAAQAAMTLAAEQGAQVIGLVVMPTYESALADMAPEVFPKRSEHEDAMRRKGALRLATLEEAAREAHLKYTPVVTLSSATAQSILDTAARYGCDLIFMAGHGHGGWNPVLIGNTTLKVLSGSPVPVLVYRNG